MDDQTINRHDFNAYRDFWQHNLEKIQEISNALEQSLYRLEKKYLDFESAYTEIMDRIDLLSSIYAQYNSIAGIEYLHKLRALMNQYKKRYTHEGINFNALYFLHARLIEHHAKSLEEFPAMRHSLEGAPAPSIKPAITRNHPYRWITFERCRSWFIVAFDEARIVGRGQAMQAAAPVLDPFEKTGAREAPERFLHIRRVDRERLYAITRPGRTITAATDIMTRMAIPLPDSAIAIGHLRLFGKRHIYLHPQAPIGPRSSH